MQIPKLSNIIYKAIHKLARDGRATEDSVSPLVELNDLNYKDALFDAQVRSFLREEYQGAEPSASIFPQLAQAIRLHNQGHASEVQSPKSKVTPVRVLAGVMSRLALQLRQAMAQVYRVGSSAGTNRVLSGGLVTMLLILAMGPSLMQTLGSASVMGNLDRGRGESNVVALPSRTESQYPLSNPLSASQLRLLLEQKTGEDFDAPYQIQEVPPLDPAELRMVEKQVGKQRIEPARKLNTKGPE
jgi:hypothetical protein